MKLSITLKNPVKTVRLFCLVWMLIIILIAGLVFFLKLSLPSYLSLVLLSAVGLLAFLNIKQLTANFRQCKGIYWDSHDWFLLVNDEKQPIELCENTRVFRHWIILEYQLLDAKSLLKKQLFLPKDAMSDFDFRNLCRTLRFVSNEKVAEL